MGPSESAGYPSAAKGWDPAYVQRRSGKVKRYTQRQIDMLNGRLSRAELDEEIEKILRGPIEEKC
jgi:hypothetical protein